MKKYDNMYHSKPKTFQEYLKIFMAHKYYIILIALIVIALGVYQTLTTNPVYQSQANLMISNNEDANQIFDLGDRLNYRTIANHIEILRSRGLKTQVVISLWESPVRDSLYLITGPEKNGKKQSIIDIWKDKAIKGVKSLIQKPYKVVDLAAEQRGKGQSFFRDDSWHQKLTRDLPPGLTRDKLEEIIKNMHIEIIPIEETSIIRIVCHAHGKKEAEYILNKFITIYEESDKNRSAQAINNMVTFLEKKINAKELELEQARRRLKNYQKSSTIFGVEASNRAMIEQATRIESQYYEISVELEGEKLELNELKAKLSSEQTKLVNQLSNTINSELRALREELALKQARLVKTSNQYGDAHSEISKLNSDIKRLKAEIENKTKIYIKNGISVSDPLGYSRDLVNRILDSESQVKALELRKEEFKKLIEIYNQKLQALPEKQMTYAKYRSQLDALEENYDFLKQRYEETKISKALKSGSVKVLDQASIAEKIKPKPVKDVLMAILIGFGLGFLFVVVKDNLNRKVETEEDLERYGLPIIGKIPYVKTNGAPNPTGVDKSVVAFHKPYSHAAEFYRKLRTNIQFSTIDRDVKTLIVTSHNPREGKTTISANLGMIYANLGKSVLLVDADMRKSKLHKLLNVKNKLGLSDYLAGKATLKDIIQETVNKNLYVITAGQLPPNPAELISSAKMRKLIQRLKSYWDITIYDAPPIQPVTDSIILCKYIDYIVVSSFSKRTTINALIDSIKEINQSNEKIGGVVLTGIKEKSMKYHYHKYYKYEGKK